MAMNRLAISTIFLLGLAMPAQNVTPVNHCVGFTGAECADAYPPTGCGFLEALEQSLEDDGPVRIGNTRTVINVDKDFEFCSHEDAIRYYTLGRRWLSWHNNNARRELLASVR